MKKVIFILGPTAVGKTFMSVNLAKSLGGEIISADSVQIYKGLDIGSAKVTEQEKQGVTHYAIDILEPEREFSVFDFVEYTKQKIDEILSHGKIPIVVGGTGLYVKALTLGYNFGGAAYDKKLREKLENLAKEKGNDYLFDMLRQKDENLAQKTDKNNTVRLVRALEIALADGEKLQQKTDIDCLVFALVRDRQKLYDDINRRVDIMIENGLVGEVENLKNKGLTKDNQSMRAIGYKEVLDYLDGQYDFDRMVELVKQHSRNYAKRQMTFLRGMQNIEFVDTEDKKKAFETILKSAKEWIEK